MDSVYELLFVCFLLSQGTVDSVYELLFVCFLLSQGTVDSVYELLFICFLLSQGTVDNVYEDVVWNRTSISVPAAENGNFVTMKFGTKEQVWNEKQAC